MNATDSKKSVFSLSNVNALGSIMLYLNLFSVLRDKLQLRRVTWVDVLFLDLWGKTFPSATSVVATTSNNIMCAIKGPGSHKAKNLMVPDEVLVSFY